MKEIIMCFAGELALKGLNKATFETMLIKQIRQRIDRFGDFEISRAQSTFYIRPLSDDIDIDEVYDKVKKVFGIASLTKAVECEKDFDRISFPGSQDLYGEECLKQVADLCWLLIFMVKRA